MVENRDIELQKIQIIESNNQGSYNFRASIIAGGLVGAFILIATMQFENVIPLMVGFILDLIVILAMPFIIRSLKKTRDAQNTFIDGLLLRVENGEELESIVELLKMQRKRG
jgi:hypothetical protein